MNNDPNNINNIPVETLEPEVLDQPVQPDPFVNPNPPEPENVVVEQPAPVVPQQPLPQEPTGLNPHQHVDMNTLTPRTVFETSVNGNTTQPTPTPTETPQQPATPNAPKGKSTVVPLVLFLLAIAAGGYFLYSQFTPKEEPIINQNEESKKETVKEPDTEKEDEAKEDKTKEEEKKDEKENPTQQPVENNAPAPAPQNNPPQPAPAPAPEPANTPSEPVEMLSGSVLYLYEDGGIGLNEIYVEYVSHTDTNITVNISLNDGTPKSYTLKYGEKTSIDGLKNKITITKEEEYFPIKIN